MSGNSIKVPAGYKQTEAGIIPSDWNAIPLSKLIEFKNGKAHENNINEFGKYLLINSKFISSNGSVVKNTNARFQPVEKKEITMVMSDVPNGRAIAKCFLVDKNNT